MKLGVNSEVAHHCEFGTALHTRVGLNGRRVFFSPSSDNGARLCTMHAILVGLEV